jgi:LysM repeat protein
LSSKRARRDSRDERTRASDDSDEIDDRSPGAPRYHQVIPADDYDEYEPEDNTAPLKIIIASLSLIFICVLAVLVYKINSVTTELENARAEIGKLYTEAQYQDAVDDSNRNKQEVAKLTKELDDLKAQFSKGAYIDASNLSGQTVYTIESGDTLGGIANKFNVSIEQLMTWNGLENDMIQQGKTLIVVEPQE